MMSTPTSEMDPYRLITKEFLESHLNCKIKGLTIESGTNPGDNYMSVLYSISVEILTPNRPNDITSAGLPSNAKGEPLNLLLKCYPSHPSRQKLLNKTNHFYRELTFYEKLAKDLVQFQSDFAGMAEDEIIQLAIPPFHGGKAINYAEGGDDTSAASQEKVYSPLDNFIFMTDMRKTYAFKMPSKREGLDVDHILLAFQELATLHALSWAYRKKVEWDLTKNYPFLIRSANTKKTDVWLGVLRENVNTAVASINSVKGKGNVLSKAIQNFCEQGRTVLDYFYNPEESLEVELQNLLRKPNPNNVMEHILCHGDCWSNNMLFQYNKDTGKPQRVVLVDFPLVKVGCPTFDLACLIYTSTRREFREAHLDKCLEAYCGRFLELCDKMKVECISGFGLDAIKSRFQVSKLVGLLVALLSLPINLIAEEEEVDLDKMDKDANMGEMLQTCSSRVKDSSLYQEWILELIEDLYNDGVI